MGEPEKMDNGTAIIDENMDTPVKNCALCGCSTPAVRCDKCGSQTFCLSCDDMYHRHPKRRYHLRKAVDSIWNTYRSPRLRRRTELPGDPSKIPVPPPRTKKRHSSSNLFNPSFDLPFGYKGFLQHKLLESKNAAREWKTSSSLSPDLSHDNKSLTPDIGVLNKSPSPSIPERTVHTQSPQRRSSADNPHAVPNSSLPIHVFVPGVSPTQMDIEGRSTLGYPDPLMAPGMHHSASTTDLSRMAPTQHMPPAYHYPPHMAAFMHPHLNPYTPQLAHLNCPQCISASWSNLMSPSMAAYHQLHMQQPWVPPQSPAPRSQNSPAPEALPQQDHSPMSFQAPGSLFQSPAFSHPMGGSFSPTGQEKKVTTSAPSELQQQNVVLPVGPIGSPVGPTAPMQQTSLGDEEMAESEEQELEEEEEETVEGDEHFSAPEKPTVEWSCVHCTYVNPPGSHICEVCCRTSYSIPQKMKKKKRPKQGAKTDPDITAVMTDQSEETPQQMSSGFTAQVAEMPRHQFPQKVMQV